MFGNFLGFCLQISLHPSKLFFVTVLEKTLFLFFLIP